MRTPQTLVDRAFVLASIAVAVSTAAFPSVKSYGTVLLQIVAFTAWTLLERVTSGEYASHHHGVLWIVAALVNVFGFWILAVPLWALARKRSQSVALSALAGLCALYIASLFWLYPATDGP
jgi:hypothetical protein